MPPFRDLFCARFGCPQEKFEKRAFVKLLYGHAKAIAPILHKLKPDLFADDFRFIRDLGKSVDLREAETSAAGFQDGNWARRSFLRNKLKFRVSGWKASELARNLFSEAAKSGDKSLHYRNIPER